MYCVVAQKVKKWYIKRYGEDETTLIPGTNKHLSFETLKEILEDKNPNEMEMM